MVSAVNSSQQTNAYNIKHNTYTPSFCANRTTQADTFEKQNSKLSNGTKWGIGLGLAALGTVLAVVLSKGKIGSNNIKQLAEHIDFKEAKTMEEAINFGKQNLGIKKYKGFKDNDLEILNYYNKGLTELSNKLKGKASMPDNVAADKLETYSNGYTAAGIEIKTNTLFINCEVCRNMRNDAANHFKELVKGGWITESGEIVKRASNILAPKDIQTLKNVIREYNFGNSDYAKVIKFEEKQKELLICMDDIMNNPEKVIRKVLLKPENQKIFEQENTISKIEDIKNLTKVEQFELAKKMIKRAGIPHFTDNIEHKTLFHEGIHLLDKSNITQRAKSIYEYGCSYNNYPSDLKSWIDNKEYQRIASQISDYAATGPSEFIAEYGSNVLRGNPVSQEATALYKKLNGPALN